MVRMSDVAGPAAWVRRVVVLLIFTPTLAAGLAFAASFVPDRLILGELAGAVERDEIILFPQVGVSGRGLDTFSDCIAVTMGLGDTDGGPATIWLRSPTLGSCNGAIPSIEAHEAGEGLSGGYEYFRYWHGYTAVSRPLLATVGVSGQRIVLFWAFIGAAVIFARRLWRFHGALAPIALLGPFLLTTDTVELARSLPHGVPAVVAVAGAWYLHRVSSDEECSELSVASTAFLAGSAFVFVDLLTTPPGAWALATGSVLLAAAGHLRGGALMRRGIVAGGAWILGWIWTWVAKWMLAVPVLGYAQVRERIGGAIDDRVAGERDYIDLALFNATDVNVQTWWAHPLTPIVAAAILVGAAILGRRNELSSTLSTRLIIAAPAMIPLVWFELLRNHSLVHPHFTYRSLGVSAGLVAVAVIVAPDSLGRDGVADASVDADLVEA